MVKNIGVIGAGIMGRGIAYTAALSGFNVVLQDISEDALARAKDYIESLLERSVEKGYVQPDERERALTNLSYTTKLQDAARDADLVIEAALEVMEIKIDIFKQLDEFAPAHAVLATNTSTMSPTEIAAATKRPEQCIAMHFFNPVHRMKLIEIIRGLDTSDETVEMVKQTAERFGKETVEVN